MDSSPAPQPCPSTPERRRVAVDWLPGLEALDLGVTMVVTDGSRPLWRHVALSRSPRSRAILLPGRLELRVAPGDHGFALALIAAFVAEDHQPAAAARSSRELLALAGRVARHDVSVLIEGATGTGKEGLAQLVHTLSPRRDCPLVAVNCAALPETMLEATLFGHERGAFTGATGTSRGLFRAAEGGSLLLDEVSELPLALQSKLLRAIQEREVLPIGATRPEKIDVRIIACANRDLAAEVGAGRFRADLFYRLAVFPLRTALLAERREDVMAIAARWLLRRGDGAIAWPTTRALSRLMAHDWPGNVRELGNILDRALVLADGEIIDIEHLVFDRLAGVEAVGEAGPAPLGGLVRVHEDRVIRSVLAECRSRRDAAERLGISERTLRYKLAAMADRRAPGAQRTVQ